MISIRRDTDYAARIVLHLSLLEDGVQITAKEIAQKRLLPKAFMRRIIGRLGAAGLLQTARGANGGIALSRPASKISLLDIIQAMEGSPALNPCVENPLACPLTEDCPVRASWTKVSKQISDSLGSIRFDHLANELKKSDQSKSVSLRRTQARQRRSGKKGDGQ
jgi:Rrf2 family transcriptional regulator, iron-sulfur cluster assembly transcription factor